MSNDFTQTVPLIDRIVERIFIPFNFLLVMVLDDAVNLFQFVELFEHVIDLIEHVQVLDYPFLFGFLLFGKGLSAYVLVLAGEATDVLVLILDNRALPLPKFDLLAELPIAFGQV